MKRLNVTAEKKKKEQHFPFFSARVRNEVGICENYGQNQNPCTILSPSNFSTVMHKHVKPKTPII